MIRNFLQELRTQRWDDHRYYHHSRINQSLHFVSADAGMRRFIEQRLQPVVRPLGFRTAEFAWSRYARWLASAPGMELAERRLVPPFGHFSLVRFRKRGIAAAA